MTKRVLPETAKKRTENQQLLSKPAKETLSSEETQILKRVNKYEFTIKFTCRNSKLFAKSWKKLSSDKYILDIVANRLRLDFKEFPKNRQYLFRTLKNDELDTEEAKVDELLRKQVICESKREIIAHLSNVFTRKKNEGKSMNLNLKQLNAHITYRHFKMESINQVTEIVRPNVYMASIDLKDAFHSIPIHPKH